MRTVYFDRFPPESGLTPAWLHPYRSARVVADGLTVGWFGQLHPHQAAARKIKDAVLVGELYLDRLYKLPLRKPAARDISRFQPVRRDFSLVLDQSIPWERVDKALASLQIPELVEWRAARSLSRCPSRRARIFTTGQRDVSGARPHSARRRSPIVPVACSRSDQQSRRAAANLAPRRAVSSQFPSSSSTRLRRYTSRIERNCAEVYFHVAIIPGIPDRGTLRHPTV